MAMEAHKLRFVRCPKCYQLLVEYPSIPVYKCGGCGTVLRAKNRAVAAPAMQANSESDEQNNLPSGHKESPQDSKSICLDEQKSASSVDQPHDNVADGIVSSPVNHTNSSEDRIEESAVSVAGNVSPMENQEETCLSIEENTQNPGITVEEAHEKSTGADLCSGSIEESENLDTSENANRGNVEKVDVSEMSILHKKNEVVQREERVHTYEDIHVESHEALIEELERSLSFSSDDEYFSDEAETSGLSDALRHQMGSRRFMLGGKMNETSRNDPHGRLIEELEMSFSDAEEPIEQHVVVADRIDGSKHDKHPPILDAESAIPCEESIPSLDNGDLEPEETVHQENRPIDNGNQGKEDIEDDTNTAKCFHGNEHPQILGHESAHPCEESIASRDNGYLESEKTFQQENGLIDNGNADTCEESIPSVDNGYLESEQTFQQENRPIDNGTAHPCEESVPSLDNGHFESEQTFQQENRPVNNGNAHPCEESISSLDNGHLESEHTFQQENRPTDNGNEGKKDIEDGNSVATDVHWNNHIAVASEIHEETLHEKEPVDAEVVHPLERNISSVDDGKSIQTDGLMAESTREKEEACMDDDSMISYTHGNENLVFTDEDKSEKVHNSEDVVFDHTRESKGSHVVDDDQANYINGEENVSSVDEHVAERIDKDEHDKDQQSLEAEFFSTEHVKSEVTVQQKVLITDGIEQVGGVMGDGNTTNSIQKDSAAVSSWSNKRTQCRLPSFNNDKEQLPYKYGVGQVQQGLSLDAEDLRSIQHFTKSQTDGSSSSLSSGSPSQGSLMHRTSKKFNNIVRHERLKKMDELRDQLSRLSSQKSMEKRYQKRGAEYQQQSDRYDAEQHLHSVDIDSIPNSLALESYYRRERPPRYQPSNPFSPTQIYPRGHFGHAQINIPYNYDMWEFNSYYQSSYAESTVPDHESLTSSYKEPKRVVRKHILRPLSGASPFSICSSCFNLVQMPSDMYISKAKIGKMQCGKCAKVLVLSFPAAYHAEGKISKEITQQLKESAGSAIAKNKDATSHSAECLRGPVSINEEYGASFTRSFSTQAGASLAATQSGKKVSDSALHRLMGYDSASQLLRHSRPLDDGYDSFESMVPVSSRVSRRKNM